MPRLPWTRWHLRDLPVYIRGGTILPLRTSSANTTAVLRGHNFTIIVAPGLDGNASGSLYVDDGESLDTKGLFSDIKFSWDGKSKRFSAEGTYGFRNRVQVETVMVLGDDAPVLHNGPWALDSEFSVRG